MDELKEKLDCPTMCCTSSSDTYKNLQDHMVNLSKELILISVSFYECRLLLVCIFLDLCV